MKRREGNIMKWKDEEKDERKKREKGKNEEKEGNKTERMKRE